MNEKILTENPVSSNLQEVPQMVSQTVITSDNQMRKIQEKVLQVMGPLPRLWKGLGNVWNESSKAAEVPVDTFATFIEQITLLIG